VQKRKRRALKQENTSAYIYKKEYLIYACVYIYQYMYIHAHTLTLTLTQHTHTHTHTLQKRKRGGIKQETEREY
jgi:hypothetical protein